MIVGVVKETFPGEHRVALIPDHIAGLTKKGLEVLVQSGAGQSAGFSDAAYQTKGARIATGRSEVFAAAQAMLFVRLAGANPKTGDDDVGLMRAGQVVIGQCDCLSCPQAVQPLAGRGATVLAMELIPRITRAQSMDVLSSMASIAGYKAVLLAAQHLPRMFPMMSTAAGTITPAKVFVIGAGVAGLQALATARRLGAVTSGYDVRPAVRDQVQSLGARFIEMDLQTGTAEDKGGYAKAMDEEFYRKQRELMTRVVAEHDVVITTAAIPGKKSPVLVTAEMVQGMTLGSIIVDLAAERGGNCELTRADETVTAHGVTILGPTNLPATVPFHASQMYSKNITTFLLNMIKDGKLNLNLEDEIIKETLLTQNGQVVHAKIADMLKSEIRNS